MGCTCFPTGPLTSSIAVVLQGYHSGSLIVALLGIFKAVVGLLIRPAVGTLELLGKSAHGIGLLFLGREGISGTIQKRARAPGTLTDDSDEVIYGHFHQCLLAINLLLKLHVWEMSGCCALFLSD